MRLNFGDHYEPFFTAIHTWHCQYRTCTFGVIRAKDYPDSKVHGANMESTWVLSAPVGPHVGPMNLSIRRALKYPETVVMEGRRMVGWMSWHGHHICYFLSFRMGEVVTSLRCNASQGVHLKEPISFVWRHNERDGVWNYQSHDGLLKRLFCRRLKKTSKLHDTGLCEGNSSVTGEFPAQRASNTENVSIWWRHHVTRLIWMPSDILPWECIRWT